MNNTIKFLVIVVFLILSNVANAQTGYTANEILATERVMKETRAFRKTVGGAMAVVGAAVGYTAVTTSIPAALGAAVLTGSLWGFYGYGATTAATEWAVHNQADKILKQQKAASAEIEKRNAQIREQVDNSITNAEEIAKSLRKRI
jgi:hypothetical protein